MMPNNSKVRKSDNTLLKEMNAYLHKLQSQPNDKACAEAKEALLRTGVTTKSGKIKEKIVSWK